MCVCVCADLHLGCGGRGRHRNEGCTIKNQMGQWRGGGHDVNGGHAPPPQAPLLVTPLRVSKTEEV